MRCSAAGWYGRGLTLVLLLVTACGGRSGRDSGAGEATGGAGGAPSGAGSELVELLIPLSPVDELGLSFLLVEDEATGEVRPDDGEGTLRLAVGAGYPDTIRLGLASMLLPSDGAPLVATDLTIEAVTSDGEGLEAIVADAAVVELRVHEPGTYSVRLDLSAAFEAGATVDFRAEVTVLALQVTGAEWSTCSAPVYLVSGSRMGSSRLNPLDEDGLSFEPRNTDFDRGADLIVSAQAGTRIEAPAGVDSLVVTGPSQTVKLRSNYGDVAAFELIQVEQIDGMAPSFFSDQGGGRGGGLRLESGGTHAVDLSQAPYIWVYPGVSIGGAYICGGPDEALFELRSTTPEVCVIQEDGCAVRGCSTVRSVPAIANIIAPGTCNLELEAPTFDHGKGLSASFVVDIESL